MEKKLPEILNKKIKKIFQHNTTSPLFAKIANNELEKNNIEKAIEILQEGIPNYPAYPVPYLLLGKAFALTGNYNLAIKNIKKGCDLIPSKKTYEFYLREIDNIRQEKALLEPGKQKSFLPLDSDIKEKDEIELTDEEIKSVDDDLEILAKKISSARIPEIPKYTGSFEQQKETGSRKSDESIIASDTLAKIYAAQGEIKEAIKVYEKLLTKYPEKTKHYNEKIEELKSKLGE